MEPVPIVEIHLRIRRYDNTDNPEPDSKVINLPADLEYHDLKERLHNLCEISPEDNKIIKLRDSDENLIPLSFLLEYANPNKYFFVDVCTVQYDKKANTTFLQDAYIDSVRQKLSNMESRIVKAELLLPQLEWKRQAHVEETVNRLSTKVSFLNRRIDELMPAQWRSKMPQTMA